MKVESEEQYRNAYTQGYRQAILDVTAYKLTKLQVKQWSLDILTKWCRFENEFQDDFCMPPKAVAYISRDSRDSKKSSEKLKYVYIIKNVSQPISFKLDDDNRLDGNYFKIGIATNIKERLSNLQTGSNNSLEVVFKFRTKHADILEKACHRFFKQNNTSGEWFHLPIAQIENFTKHVFPKLVEIITKDSKKYDNKFPKNYINSIIRNSNFEDPIITVAKQILGNSTDD